MIIGSMQVSLRLYASDSLKDKRFVTQSVKKRLVSRFNVSLAEVGGQDSWKDLDLAIVTVANQKALVDREFEKVTRFLDGDVRFEVVDRTLDFY